jgi:hypothetical protein
MKSERHYLQRTTKTRSLTPCIRLQKSQKPYTFKLDYKRVTKRCRLSWWWCGVSANEYSYVHGAQINFGDLNSIFNLCGL